MTAESDTRILDTPILDLHDDPTVRDLDPDAHLGMQPPRSIWQTIRRHIEERQRYGIVHPVRTPSPRSVANISDDTEYHLTEPKVLRLCQLSRAPRTAIVRRMLITAFLRGRRGDDHGAPIGPPDRIGGRQGSTNRSFDPHSKDATPMMVIVLGPIAGDVGGSVH